MDCGVQITILIPLSRSMASSALRRSCSRARICGEVRRVKGRSCRAEQNDPKQWTLFQSVTGRAGCSSREPYCLIPAEEEKGMCARIHVANSRGDRSKEVVWLSINATQKGLA